MKLLNYQPGELQQKLQHYLDTDTTYKLVYDYTWQQFDVATNLTAHNWAHAYRDTLNAIVIGEAEHADMRIVLPAITMHDIGFLYGAEGRTHGAIGAEKLTEYLQTGHIHYDAKDIAKIASCIRTHKGSMHNEKPETLEAKVVADADLLEKFGPFGVYQYIRAYTEFNRPLDYILKRGNDIFDLTLETETGKSIVEPGRQFIANFFRGLAEANEAYTS